MGLINDLMAKLPGVEGGQIKVEPVEDLGDGSTEKGNKQKATPVIYTPAAHHASYVNSCGVNSKTPLNTFTRSSLKLRSASYHYMASNRKFIMHLPVVIGVALDVIRGCSSWLANSIGGDQLWKQPWTTR